MIRSSDWLRDEANARAIAVLAAAAAALLTLVLELDSTVHALLVFSFLLVCPGLALLAPLRLEGLATKLTLAIAVSVALEAIVATVMLYAGAWSPDAILLVVVGVTAGATVLDLLRSARARAAADPEVP